MPQSSPTARRCEPSLAPAALAFLLFSCLTGKATFAADKAADKRPAPVDFARQIQPLLEKRCVKCHGQEKQESAFRVDRRESMRAGGDLGEPAVVPGDADESRLMRVLEGDDDDLIMPPDGPRLNEAQLALFRRWIDEGARMPAEFKPAAKPKRKKHWSLQPLRAAKRPPLADPWVRNPIDGFILRRLRAEGLTPSAPADRVRLIRRLFLVMHGIPPSVEEVRRFTTSKDPQAYAKLVERVLDSPRYGERWARHWLDVVRFGETDGFETNRERPHAYHYRDYVIRAFNDDKPYDQFVREQIAGDQLDADVATGFLVAGPYDKVKSPDINLTLMQRQDELADILHTTGSTFLGLTIGCARCHDHKFDPISQRDYYSLQAVFAGVQHGNRAIQPTPQMRTAQQRVRAQVEDLQKRLARWTAPAKPGSVTIIDDTHRAQPLRRGVSFAGKIKTAPLAAGTARGQRDDPGDAGRAANLNGGSYSYGRPGPGTFATYHLQARGKFRVWLSWGCGWDTHARQAQYVLDQDGDPETASDQKVLATVDQRRFADGTASPANQSLWSGLLDAGLHELQPSAVVWLRGAKGDEVVTADAVLLRAVGNSSFEAGPAASLPRFRKPVNSVRNVESFAPVTARFIRFTVRATNNGSEPCLDELEAYSGDKNVALAASGARATASGTLPGHKIHQLPHIHDGKHGNGQSWISNQRGRGWVQIELPKAVSIDRIVWGRDRERRYTDRVPTRYVIEVAETPGQWRIVASHLDRLPLGGFAASEVTFDFAGPPAGPPAGPVKNGSARVSADTARAQLARLQALLRTLQSQTKAPMAYAGSFQQPGPTHRLYRGEPQQKREELGPDTIRTLGTLKLPRNAPEAVRRKAFAAWLTHPTNPLTPRVFVNRLWHYHFGRGIVATPSDFGANGLPPSHPELLDWLAAEAIRGRWSVKHIHRLILLSNTFRQSSKPRAEPLAKDASTRLLWRFPPRRLEAEAIRDCTLAVSGVLNLQTGGPGFSGFEVQLENVRHYFPKKSFGPAEWRRMIYMTKVRQEQDAVFGAFDCPDASQAMPRRSRSTTPLQALNLFNSRFMMQQYDLLAKRLTREAGDRPESQLQRAFQLCYGRAAEADEVAAGERLVKAHGLPALCRALLNSNEFLFIP